MREMVAVLAILGAIAEAITAIGGPQLAGVGMIEQVHAPPMPMGPLLVGLAVAAVSLVAGSLVAAGRSAPRLGAVMIVASAIGIAVVGPYTGFFTISALFTV